MRTGAAVFLCVLLAAAPAAAVQSCGGPVLMGVPKQLEDRSWIRSDAVFYGADERGLFRMRLGSNEVQRIGAHAGEKIGYLALSPRKHWLRYEATGKSGAREHWLYEIGRAREHKFDIRSAGEVEAVFSPGETRLAWLEREGAEHRLAVLDLNSFAVRSFRLLNAPDPKAIYFDLTWSAAGDRLTYAWRDLEHEEFYSVDPIAGVANSIPLQREFAADEFVEASYLLGNGELDGLPVQPIHESKDRIALERGASVQYANRKIVVAAPKQAARTIAAETTLAPGCGPSLSLMDAFNGRYVLYRASNVYWIYGLRENRKAILYRGAGVLEW